MESNDWNGKASNNLQRLVSAIVSTLVNFDYVSFRNAATGCPRPEQGGSCQLKNKKLRHGCSKLDSTGRICWQKHREADH